VCSTRAGPYKLLQWLLRILGRGNAKAVRGSGGGVAERRLLLPVDDAEQDAREPSEAVWLRYQSDDALEFSEGSKSPDTPANLTVLELEDGIPGLRWARGLPVSHEHNTAFRPTTARGRTGRLGTYHELFLTSTTFRRAWSGIAQALVTGVWKVRPATSPDGEPFDEDEQKEAEHRAAVIQQALLVNLEGGWANFVREGLYMLVAGFSVFEEVFRETDDDMGPAGSIRKLAFRYPGTVKRWILDDHERDLVAVEFETGATVGGPKSYTIDAGNLLLYTYDRFGNNFEGIPPMRSAARWIQALQLLQQLEMIAAEKFGSPWAFARRVGNDLPLVSDDETTLVDIVDAAVAAENPVIVLPDNAELNITSPAGHMPNFEPGKRFCLERIAEVLKAEGSLIGLGQTGAFAARMDASAEFIRFAPYFGELILAPLNGADNVPYTGTIPKMESAIFGDPIRPGAHSTLTYSIGDLEDTNAMAKLQMGVAAGAVEITDDVKDHVHEKLNLPARKRDPVARMALAPQGESDAI